MNAHCLPVTDSQAQLFRHAQAMALEQLERHALGFGALFPDDTTVNGVYPLRPASAGQAGANLGWTTGFWTTMTWVFIWPVGGGGRHHGRRAPPHTGAGAGLSAAGRAAGGGTGTPARAGRRSLVALVGTGLWYGVLRAFRRRATR